MLRHFKMELKRQQELENIQQQQQQHLQPSRNLLQVTQQQPEVESELASKKSRPLATAVDATQANNMSRRTKGGQQQQRADGTTSPIKTPKELQAKRVRGRRSSKPAMEKRRRARINECLDILKSYVLNDTGNLNRLGIDLSVAGAENRLDEDSIAREILKSSGLINRHRGRKNPNKLEKADILELTVDYVTRLHKQRDELLVTAVLAPQQQQQPINRCYQMSYSGGEIQQQQVPAHLSEPLTLDLSPKSRLSPAVSATTPPTLQAYRPPPNTPLTPPSSAGSSDGTNMVAYQQQHQAAASQVSQMQLLSQVLADGRYKSLQDYVSFP